MSKRAIIIGLAIAIVIAVIFTVFLPSGTNGYRIMSKVTITKDEKAEPSLFYKSFCKGIVRGTKDGISLYDSSLKLKWIKSYNMKSPIYTLTEKYFAVADRGGNSLFIFDKNGVCGEGQSDKVIKSISITEEGFVYAILEDEDYSYINLFDKTGKVKDISIKYNVAGEGYPLDISASPNATELMVSMGHINKNNHFSSKLLFYNFDEVGKNVSADRIVGHFNDFEDKFVAKVNFSDNTYSQAYYNGGIKFYSTQILTHAECIREYEYSDKILSIDYSDNICVAVLENGEMIVFDKKGNELTKEKIDTKYNDFYLSSDCIVFQNGSRLNIYTKNGNTLFKGDIISGALKVEVNKSVAYTSLLVGTNTSIYKLKVN